MADAIDRHLDRMITGFSSSEVRINGAVGRGLLRLGDVEDVDRNGDPIMRTAQILLLRVADWPDLRAQQTAEIDGVSYRMSTPSRSGDGRYYRVQLRGGR